MHLVHATILTDLDQRKIRSLYLSAMKNNRILDYYAASNEYEYFAQIYPAYFSTMAVHPQDFKSLNTQSILKTRDPEAYHFVDSLVKVENQFLLGNQNVFRDQWAQLYIQLSQNSDLKKEADKLKAKSYLDTAASWDKDYLPLLISEADLALKTGDQDKAEIYLKRAESLNPNYSPIFEENYELNRSLEVSGLLDYNSAYELEKSDLLKAISLEIDPVIKSDWRQKLIELYKSNSLIPDEVQTLEALYKEIIAVSSSEKNRKNLVLADKIKLSLELGYPDNVETLEKVYLQDPQNYEFVSKYADCLFDGDNKNKAVSILEKCMAIQNSTGKINVGLALELANYQADLGNISRAREILHTVLHDRMDSSLIMIKTLAKIGDVEKAEKLLSGISLPHDFYPKSDYYSLKGDIKLSKGLYEEAISAYMDALANNPYNFLVAQKLSVMLTKLNRTTALAALKTKLIGLPIKPGPLLDFNKP